MGRRWTLPERGVARWATIVAVNVVVFVGMVAVVELLTSLVVTWPRGNRVAHPILHHTWKPESSFTHSEWIPDNPDYPDPYTHVYNAQGWLEDYDVAPTKAPGVFRIFYLGDSFTEGTAPMDQSVPSLVEDELNRRGAAIGHRFEVINTGTSSYSPTIYYVLLRRVLPQYEPDLVVINVGMTDAHDDWKYARSLEIDAAGNPAAVRPSLPYRIELFLYNHSYTYHYIRAVDRWLRGARQSVVADRGAKESEGPSPVGWFDWCEEWEWSERTAANAERTLDLLRRIAAFGRESGLTIVLTGVPHHQQYAGSADGSGEPAWTSRPHYAMEEVAREESVPYLNAFEALQPAIAGTPWTRYYYAGDMHFNPAGYRIWADAHIEFLMDPANGLLPESMYDPEDPPDSPPTR